MRVRSMMVAGLALATVPLAGCYDEDYGYGYARPGYYSRAYYPSSYGWYDNYYGPVYDGYWGNSGYYYYRSHSRDRWHRDDGRHFRHGAVSPGGTWQRYDRAAPPRNWQGRGRGWEGRGRGHDDDRGRGHGRGRGHDRDD